MGHRVVNLDLYKIIYTIRKSEQSIQAYYHEDDMKTPMHMSMGSEAISAGVCHALDDHDQVFGTYRSHALYLAKTNDIAGLFGEMYGKISGKARGKAGSMHLSYPEKGHMGSSAIVGTSLPIAVGAAFFHKFTKSSHIAVSFFGDGAIDEGAFWESMNLACSMRVPVLFVCEDNQYAVHTHASSRQGYRKLKNVISGFDCLFEHSSSTNPVEIHKLASEMIEKVRLNRPGMLHLEYYRYLEHVGIQEDFDAGYRRKPDAEEWYIRDPVSIMRVEAIKANGIPMVIKMEAEVDCLIATAVAEAKSSAFPDDAEVCKGVFSV